MPRRRARRSGAGRVRSALRVSSCLPFSCREQRMRVPLDPILIGVKPRGRLTLQATWRHGFSLQRFDRRQTALRCAPDNVGMALFALGFRPFYLVAGLYAALALPIYAAQYAGWLPGV